MFRIGRINKLISCAIFILTGTGAHAQTPKYLPDGILNQTHQVSIPAQQNINGLQIPCLILDCNQYSFAYKGMVQNKIGKHYQFVQTYQQKPIYATWLHVSISNSGIIYRVSQQLVDLTTIQVQDNYKESTCWLLNQNTLVPVKEVIKGFEKQYITQTNEILINNDTRLFFTDTTIKARVFNPDPLTTAGVVYGANGTYRHFNDSDYALLNNQRVWVDIPATYQNGKFELSNKYATITNIRGPSVDPASAETDTFDFTRKQDGFKDVMALYHIYALRQYLQQLGYTNIVPYSILVDAHALTADQSYFTFSSDTSLNFGLGGVPDAEDADVIVHEYTHAIMHSLNIAGIISTERRALEEGLCDVMCCAYSKRLNPFRWKRIFSWDGNNEFWGGRNGESTKTYANKVGDFYSDSEIISSALNNIIEIIGEDELIDLMMTIMPQLTPSSTLPQAARLIYEADSIKNNGLYRAVLAIEFNQRQLGTFAVGEKELNIADNFSIINTAGFAGGSADAIIKAKNGSIFQQVIIFTIDGKQLKNFTSKEEISLSPQHFEPGIYYVKVLTNEGTATIKLQRY